MTNFTRNKLFMKCFSIQERLNNEILEQSVIILSLSGYN